MQFLRSAHSFFLRENGFVKLVISYVIHGKSTLHLCKMTFGKPAPMSQKSREKIIIHSIVLRGLKAFEAQRKL